MLYKERTYRNNLRGNTNLTDFTVCVHQSDLFIRADRDLSVEAREAILKYRYQIETHIRAFPDFLTSMYPLDNDNVLQSPDIICEMLRFSMLVGVGPMAGIAGAIAEFVGKELLPLSDNIIIENGGDIFIKTKNSVKTSIFAGTSNLSNKFSILIKPEMTPLGICTSSGTVGESISFGKADAVCVTSKSTILADCVATAIGNIINSPADIKAGLKLAQEIQGVTGCIIIIGNKIGSWGEIEFC